MATAITIASLAYFGFFRQGCVCPIGSIQNVAAAAVEPTLAVPPVVLAFFLAATDCGLVCRARLLWGRLPAGRDSRPRRS